MDPSTRASEYLQSLSNEIMDYDRIKRTRVLTNELETLPAVVADVAAMRRAAIHEMRDDGFSVQEIADAMGKSRARVYELLRG